MYRPEGYRAVRDILFAFEGEDARTAASLTEQLELGEADDAAR